MTTPSTDFDQEVKQGQRFRFGANWADYSKHVDDERIEASKVAIRQMLQRDRFDNVNVIDIGSGSGLSSLAFRSMGARVTSFDYDPDSYQCTLALREHNPPKNEEDWRVLRGSVLDKEFMDSLGTYEIVYSWGVLHHTGKMWEAISNASRLVQPGGLLHIGIYKDKGRESRFWSAVKKTYNQNILGKAAMTGIFVPYYFTRGLFGDLVRFRAPWTRYKAYKKKRGMSIYHDWIDWIGGYPYEYAKPEELFHFLKERGFELVNLKTVGMVELVVRRTS